MHNIPAFVLITLTIIAWKNEKTGGALFILLGIIIITILSRGRFQTFLFLSLPLIIIGSLFLANYYNNQKDGRKRSNTKTS